MISRFSRFRITIPMLIILVAALTSPAFAGTPKSAKNGSGEPVDPVFHSISISKNKVTAGETITVEVVADKGDVPLSNGYVRWESPSGQSMLAELSYDKASGKLRGPLHIHRYAEAGEWSCNTLMIFDENYGGIGLFSDLAEDEASLRGANITVSNDNPDLVPPVLQSVSVNITQVKPGDTIKVTVKATDDLSGLKGGFVEWAPSSAQLYDRSFYAELEYNSANRVLEGTTTVPEEAALGEWTVQSIVLRDNADNATYMLSDDLKDVGIDISKCKFNVSIEKVSANDVAPPVIISPTSGDRYALGIVDLNPKKPGLQFVVSGMAVQGYKINLVSGGKTIASVGPIDGDRWYAEVTANTNLSDIYAVAITPNGQKSEKVSALTRAQTMKLLIKSTAIELETEHQGFFKDVPSSSAYSKHIETAVELGIICTDTSGLFKPNDTLSRGEFIKWFYNSYNGPDEEITSTESTSDVQLSLEPQPSYLPYFSDVPQSSPYARYINTMYDYHEISGNPNGTFKPDDLLSASLKLTGFSKVNFSDIKTDNWCAGYVFDLTERGIVSGYKGGMYMPRQTVTRAEFAKMICKIKGWSVSETASAGCIGVPPTHWAYSYIRTLSQNNVIEGYPCNSFRADQKLTRAEAVKMIVRTQGFKLDTTSETFADVIGHWASDYILTAKRHNLISGYSDGSFQPDNNITRAEAAKIIWQLIEVP